MNISFRYFNVIHYVVWILTAAIFYPTFLKLYSYYWDVIDYTHAYFILPIFLWFVWRKRSILKSLYSKQKTTSNYLGLFIFILGLYLFVFGQTNQYFFIITFAFVFVIFGLVNYLYGLKITKVLCLPILYLLLLVPIPKELIDTVTLPMRYGVSATANAILDFFTFPVTREGLLLTINNNELFMGEPCSGFRSLITLLSLFLAYIYISKSRMINKSILVACIVPAALTGNLIRVITICLLTFYFGQEVGQGVFHGFSGIIIFSFTTIILVCIELALTRTIPKCYSN